MLKALASKAIIIILTNKTFVISNESSHITPAIAL